MNPITRAPKVTTLGLGANLPHTGDTAETTLATITVPAGLMGATGQIEVECLFSYPNSANNKEFKVKFGGTTFYDQVFTTTTTSQCHVRIANSATNVQVGQASNSLGYSSNTGGKITAAVDTTAAVDIVITGKLSLNTETLILESYSVKLLRA